MRVYPRAERKLYGLTSEQTAEAVSMYEEKLADDVIKELKQDGVDLDDKDHQWIKDFAVQMIKKGIWKGMTWADDPRAAARYYESQKPNEVNKVQVYEFEQDKGVSGVLFADGSFKKCGNAEHRYLVEDMTFEQQHTCLYFSCRCGFLNDGVVSNSPVGEFNITDEQINWIEQNYDHLDQQQRDIVRLRYIAGGIFDEKTNV